MSGVKKQKIMDYTIAPAGLYIEGNLSTGQATTRTAPCPKCGRVGVLSVVHNDARMIVHRGRISDGVLEGIDYCELSISPSPASTPEQEPGGETLRTNSEGSTGNG